MKVVNITHILQIILANILGWFIVFPIVSMFISCFIWGYLLNQPIQNIKSILIFDTFTFALVYFLFVFVFYFLLTIFMFTLVVLIYVSVYETKLQRRCFYCIGGFVGFALGLHSSIFFISGSTIYIFPIIWAIVASIIAYIIAIISFPVQSKKDK